MKFCLFVLVALNVAVGLKKNSTGFLEAKTREEYTPNPDGYLENGWDMTWVILHNAFQDTNEADGLFGLLYNCADLFLLETDLQTLIENELDDPQEHCDTEIAGGASLLLACFEEIYQMMSSCGVADEETFSVFYTSWNEYESSLSITSYATLLKTRTETGDEESSSEDDKLLSAVVKTDEITIQGNLIINYVENSKDKSIDEEEETNEEADEITEEETEEPVESEEEEEIEEEIEDETEETTEEETEETKEEETEEAIEEEEGESIPNYDEIATGLQTIVDDKCT